MSEEEIKLPMQELKEKLQICADEIEEEFSDGVINRFNAGYKEALISVVKDIDAQMLEKEKQLLSEPVKPVPDKECDKWCGMNYCDDNGCMNRKRVHGKPVEDKHEPLIDTGVGYFYPICKGSWNPKEVDDFLVKQENETITGGCDRLFVNVKKGVFNRKKMFDDDQEYVKSGRKRKS